MQAGDPRPLDANVALAGVACILTVLLPLLGLVLLTSGAARQPNAAMDVLLWPMHALGSTAPWGIVVPVACLGWLNVALLRRANRSGRVSP